MLYKYTRKSVISTCSGAKPETEADIVEPYLKNLMKTSQLVDYCITHNTSNQFFSIILRTVSKGLFTFQRIEAYLN